MQVTREQLEAIRRWAAQNPEIASVYLFGSRVKGTARPESDLDVAIELALGATAGHLVVVDKGSVWLDCLQDATGLTIDLEPMLGASPSLRKFIADHGVRIYEAGDDIC
jgi:predicted nucleotidyltransferase